MKQIWKAISILILFSLLLVSCGPVTAVPTATVVPSQTATSQPTVTVATEMSPDIQTLISTELWKNLPPSHLVDTYQLIPWTPKFYETLTDLLDRVNEKYYPYLYYESREFRAAFSSETWLRTDSKMDNNPLLCKVNYYDPAAQQFPKQRVGQDLFSFFAEDLINNRGIKIEDFPDAFSDLTGTPDCLGSFSLYGTGNIFFESNTLHNVFGDGQDSYVFAVGSIFSESDRVAFYATHTVDGAVRVERVRNWEQYFPFASTYSFHVVDVGDLNKNGQNEFVVQVDFGASGIPTRESEWIYLYEWDPKVLSFKESERFVVFLQECDDGPCYGDWKFSPNNKDTWKLSAQEHIYTNLIGSECELITRKKEYLFGFRNSTLFSDNYLLPDGNSPACQVSWAYQTLIQPGGWKNDRAIQIISNALTDWPKEMDENWGIESRNYFQLKLALWEDFRGEAEQALAIFGSLRTQQHNSKPTFIAQLAQSYVSDRQQAGLVMACSKMNSLEKELLSDKDTSEAKSLMGFWDLSWSFLADDFCDEEDALSTWFSSNESSLQILSQGVLKEWLVDQGKENIYIRKVIIDNQEVWLASFLTNTSGGYDVDFYQLWAFSDLSSIRNAIFLNEMSLDPNRSVIADRYNEYSVIVETLESHASPQIVLAEFDDCLSFLKVTSTELKILKQICEVELAFSQEGEHVKVMASDTYPNNWKFSTYSWNSLTEAFEEIPSLKFDFDSVQHEAESLIYTENDYIGAIVYINNALLLSPPDRVIWPDCYEYFARRADELETQPNISLCEQPMEWHRPYLLYLLALSYEMDGQTDNAKLTYYSLWHDYPQNVLGVAARLRLKLINP